MSLVTPAGLEPGYKPQENPYASPIDNLTRNPPCESEGLLLARDAK
jgi:hypothetical protein